MIIKTFGIATAIMALAFASCQKPTVETAPQPAREPVVETPPPATPAPATPKPAALAATPAPHLAPEGVFYLISWVRVENSDGVVGLPPGTGVKRVRTGVYLTPVGESPLSEGQITNDLDIARRARDSALASQSAAKQRVAQEENKARRAASSVKEGEATHAGQLKEIDQQRLNATLAALIRQKETLEAQVASLSKEQGKENYDKVFKGRIVTSSTSAQLTTARAQLTAVEQQIMDTRTELRKMK